MNWPRVSLGQITSRIRNGLTISQSSGAGGLPITRIETISNSTINPNKVGYADLELGDADDYLLESGDILLSHINSETHIGKCAIYEGAPCNLLHGMNLLSLRGEPSMIGSRFLLYLLRSSVFRSQLPQITKRAVNQASISIGTLRKLIIPLPPLSEQCRIVELLDQADSLRCKRSGANDLAARILPSLFRKMFGDPQSDSKWPCVPLESIAETTSGGTPDRGNPNYYGGEIPWVKSGELRSGIITSTEEKITEQGLQNSSAKMMPPGTILIALYGATVGALAQLGIRAATNQAVCCISPGENLDGEYLLTALSLLTPTLLSQRVGGAQPNISQKIVRNLGIPHPPIDLQREFASHAHSIRSIAAACHRGGQEIENLFQTMHHRAFTGELTAGWRTAHMKELLAEMELQSKALNRLQVAA